MTSPKLALLERKLGVGPKQEKPPVPDSHSHGLGVAIEKLIEDIVQQRVQDALQQRQQVQQSPHVNRLMGSFNAPVSQPPAPRTPPKNLSAQLFRDGAGVTRWIEINGLKFEVQRDGAEKVIGMRQVDESPVLPQPDIAFKSEARK